GELPLLLVGEIGASALGERVDRIASHLRLLRKDLLHRGVVQLVRLVLDEPLLPRGLVLALGAQAVDRGTDARDALLVDRVQEENRPDRPDTAMIDGLPSGKDAYLYRVVSV